MRVYIVSAVYPPEPMTSARVARDIAEEMTRRGHEVFVFAPFPNRPTGKIVSPYRRRWKEIERRDGYEVIHSWHTLSPRSTIISRIMENISFGITSTIQLLRNPNPDVVYLNTWPLFAQGLTTYALSWRRVPLVCAVKDLYPESFFGEGDISRKNLFFYLGRAIDRRVYQHSTLVAPLNSFMAEHIITTRSIPPSKVQVVNDWVDASFFPENQPTWNIFRKQHRFSPELFLAMYVGSMTRMAGLELYVQAAEQLRHRQDIRIVLVGDGAMREEVEGMIQEKNLENIQIIYPLEPEDVPEVQAASDVLLLSLLPGGADHALPSKLIYYMFSQRPILANVKRNSPPARVIQEAKCGYISRQGSPQDLADHLMKMAEDRPALRHLGENSRHYAEKHFLKENVLPYLCNLIEKVGNRTDQS